MNQQGVFLTLMVFLIGIIVVGLAISNANIQKERESLVAEDTARERVNEQFSEAYSAVSDFLQNESVEVERSRLLPFKYSISQSKNQVKLQQTMPINAAKFDEFNDYLNLYDLFWNSKSDLNANFSFEKLKNEKWTGNAWQYNGYSFKILPQCVVYRLDPLDNDADNDVRILRLTKGTIADSNCEFDRQKKLDGSGSPDVLRNWYEIQKIIVTIHSDQNYEINPTCDGEFFDESALECWKKPFDSNRGWPYGEVNFMAGNEVYASMYNHFNPDSAVPQEIDFNLNTQYEGALQKVIFGPDPNNPYTPYPQLLLVDLSSVKPDTNPIVDVTIVFRRPVESFQLENLSLSIENISFGIRRLSLNQRQIGYCGDENCAAPTETFDNCPKDCTCGNGICEAWENPSTCSDCHTGTPGDKICSDSTAPDSDCGCFGTDASKAPTCDPGETIATCSADCAWTCGNGTCDSGETVDNCPSDNCRDCQDACPSNGYKECISQTTLHQCGYYSGNCLSWGTILGCGPGQTCNPANGQCQSGSHGTE